MHSNAGRPSVTTVNGHVWPRVGVNRVVVRLRCRVVRERHLRTVPLLLLAADSRELVSQKGHALESGKGGVGVYY